MLAAFCTLRYFSKIYVFEYKYFFEYLVLSFLEKQDTIRVTEIKIEKRRKHYYSLLKNRIKIQLFQLN